METIEYLMGKFVDVVLPSTKYNVSQFASFFSILRVFCYNNSIITSDCIFPHHHFHYLFLRLCGFYFSFILLKLGSLKVLLLFFSRGIIYQNIKDPTKVKVARRITPQAELRLIPNTSSKFIRLVFHRRTIEIKQHKSKKIEICKIYLFITMLKRESI